MTSQFKVWCCRAHTTVNNMLSKCSMRMYITHTHTHTRTDRQVDRQTHSARFFSACLLSLSSNVAPFSSKLAHMIPHQISCPSARIIQQKKTHNRVKTALKKRVPVCHLPRWPSSPASIFVPHRLPHRLWHPHVGSFCGSYAACMLLEPTGRAFPAPQA